jgi:hypothetical protein
MSSVSRTQRHTTAIRFSLVRLIGPSSFDNQTFSSYRFRSVGSEVLYSIGPDNGKPVVRLARKVMGLAENSRDRQTAE